MHRLVQFIVKFDIIENNLADYYFLILIMILKHFFGLFMPHVTSHTIF